MSLFHNLLEEISKKIQGNEFYKDNISKELSDLLGIKITTDQLNIINGKLYIKASPTIKTVIKLKNDLLIKSLNKYKINEIK